MLAPFCLVDESGPQAVRVAEVKQECLPPSQLHGQFLGHYRGIAVPSPNLGSSAGERVEVSLFPKS